MLHSIRLPNDHVDCTLYKLNAVYSLHSYDLSCCIYRMLKAFDSSRRDAQIFNKYNKLRQLDLSSLKAVRLLFVVDYNYYYYYYCCYFDAYESDLSRTR